MIEAIILPDYPQIQDVIINSSFFRGAQSHDVLLIADGLTAEDERNIARKIETLYRMSSIASENNTTGPRDFIEVKFG